MAELFKMLLTSFEKGDDIFVQKALDLFLSRIKSGQSSVIPHAVNAFLESVFDPKSAIGNIAVYAQATGISQNYLSRQVKQATGRSVGAWIDIARLVRAKKLLAGTSMPIIDIASAVGLDDQSYFARFFRQKTGQTPSEFRKSMQGVTMTEKGAILTCDSIVPLAMGGEFPNYTVKGFEGEIINNELTFSLKFGSTPTSYHGKAQ